MTARERSNPVTISATVVKFDNNSMWVELSDGRTIGVPYAWFPRLLTATPKQREAVEIGRLGMHWQDLDEDISIAGLLAGRGDHTVKPRGAGQARGKGERGRHETSKARRFHHGPQRRLPQMRHLRRHDGVQLISPLY
jgi:uncharacterized protein DUF2442